MNDCQPNAMMFLTDHAALLLDERANVAEYLVELMYTCLNLPNLGFPFLYQGLLKSELLWRQLRLQDLGLPL